MDCRAVDVCGATNAFVDAVRHADKRRKTCERVMVKLWIGEQKKLASRVEGVTGR